MRHNQGCWRKPRRASGGPVIATDSNWVIDASFFGLKPKLKASTDTSPDYAAYADTRAAWRPAICPAIRALATPCGIKPNAA